MGKDMPTFMFSCCQEFDCLCSCPTVGLQVVVAGDATFQDVKTEIARVYQGLSSASLDERYARRLCLISVSLGDESYCLCLPIYVHAVSYPVCSFNQISLATYMLWSLGDENCYSKTSEQRTHWRQALCPL